MKSISFTPALAAAIIDGHKTQTRRLVNLQPPGESYQIAHTVASTEPHYRDTYRWLKTEALRILDETEHFKAPYRLGGELWVRESYYRHGRFEPTGKLTKTGKPELRFVGTDRDVVYMSNEKTVITPATNGLELGWHRRPSIFMPRTASRITLRINAIRVQRLQEITEVDALCEGLQYFGDERGRRVVGVPGLIHTPLNVTWSTLDAFRALWDKINGELAPWAKNRYVWAYGFKVLEVKQ